MQIFLFRDSLPSYYNTSLSMLTCRMSSFQHVFMPACIHATFLRGTVKSDIMSAADNAHAGRDCYCQIPEVPIHE